METFTIALLQATSVGADVALNLAKGEELCRRARSLGADLALFPEMWSTGYVFEGPAGPGPAAVERALAAWGARALPADHGALARFGDLAAELEMAVALTFLEATPSGPRNTVRLFDRRGAVALTYAKVHTCSFDLPESALTPGDAHPVATLDTAAGPVAVGAMICFDREHPESARLLMLGGAEVVVVPNACELEANRLGQVRARAFENMVAVAVANYAAPQANGHSVAYLPQAFDERGRSRDTCLVEAGTTEDVALARVDLDDLRAWRRREVWGDRCRRPATYGALTRRRRYRTTHL